MTQNDINKLALDALKTCTEGGYVDVDRDWVRTFRYDAEKVATAIAALEAVQTEPTSSELMLSALETYKAMLKAAPKATP